MRTRFRVALGWTALVAAVGGSLAADQTTGRLRGVVTDPSGIKLPGVTIRVTLTDGRDHEIRITNRDGGFRYTTLEPGSYDLDASLDGFVTATLKDIAIQLGMEKPCTISLKYGSVAESVTVISDESLRTVIANFFSRIFGRDDLERPPSSRDTGAIAAAAPGVLDDRVNVGGSEGGDQPAIVAGGSAPGDTTYLVDGMTVTDPVDAGGSLLEDQGFETIEEVQVATGGAAVENTGAGAVINLLTRAGTNQWRSSSRYGRTDSSLQSEPAATGTLGTAAAATRSPGAEARAQTSGEDGAETGNRIEQIERFSLDLGGPLKKDRAFIWAGIWRSNIDRAAIGGGLELTDTDGWSVKADGMLSKAARATVLYTTQDRATLGRGAAPDRAPETTLDEAAGSELWKVELALLLPNDLAVTARYGAVRNATRWLPLAATPIDDASAARSAADPGAAEAIRDAAGIWRQGFLSADSVRESDEVQVTGSYLPRRLPAHDLSFGVSYRSIAAASGESWPGRGVVNVQGDNFGLDAAVDVAIVTRDSAVDGTSEVGALWLQDSIRRDRWSIDAGLRLDLQEGRNRPSSVTASRFLPGLLPALDFAGNDGGFTWTVLSPRFEAIRSFGSRHRTRLRLGYARFAEQLGQALVTRLDAAAPSAAYFFFEDADGNGVADLSELSGSPFLCVNCSLIDPASPLSPNRTDPDLSPALTDELRLGLERELNPRWSAGLAASYRRISDIAEERRLVVDATGAVRVATRADYLPDGTVSGVLPGGETYRAPYFALRPELRFTGGTLLTTGDREQDYLGLTLRLDRRRTSKSPWGFHAQITRSDWTWNVPAGFDAFDDPTDDEDPGDIDGAIVAQPILRSAGSEALWLNSRWSFDVSGFYRVQRWDLDLGVYASGREGYPNPLRHRVVGSDGIVRDVAVSDPNRGRHPDVLTVDLRLEKRFRLGRLSPALSLEVFNVANTREVLRRERSQTILRANFATETVNPRLVRLSLRLRL